MTIDEIAKQAAERINPTLTKSIDAAKKSNNLEIIHGRIVLMRQRTATVAIIRNAILLALDLDAKRGVE